MHYASAGYGGTEKPLTWHMGHRIDEVDGGENLGMHWEQNVCPQVNRRGSRGWRRPDEPGEMAEKRKQIVKLNY